MKINNNAVIFNASVFQAMADDMQNGRDFIVVCRNKRYPIKERANNQFDAMLLEENLQQAPVYTIADPSEKDASEWLGVRQPDMSGYVLFKAGVSTREYVPLDVESKTIKNAFDFIKDTVTVTLILAVIGAIIYAATFGTMATYNTLLEKLGTNGLFSITMLIAIIGFITHGARKSNRVSIDTAGSVAFLILAFLVGNILIYLFG